MSNALTTTTSKGAVAITASSDQSMFVTVSIENQLFGIPVLQVQDILGPQKITHVPLAPPEVLGSLNLRGRIVTAIDVRVRLNLPPHGDSTKKMSAVIDFGGELYSLVVDKVGEVMSLSQDDFEPNPATLAPQWRDISNGIYRLKDNLLVVLDVARLLRLDKKVAA